MEGEEKTAEGEEKTAEGEEKTADGVGSEDGEKKKSTTRWARKQTDAPIGNLPTDEDEGYIYNLWYHKHVGFKRKRDNERAPAETRCSIVRDQGKTKGQTNSPFCLHFARGQCCRGRDCPYLHRLPDVEDELRLPLTHDIFGRERFSTDREDMGGVGSFNRECRTLYIGGMKNMYKVDLHELVWENFSEWGEIEEVKLFANRGFGFLRYKLRSQAEFAKEAMDRQSLGYGEVLTVKWATEDPHKETAERIEEERKKMLIEAIQKRGISTVDAAFNYPERYQLQEPAYKKQKLDKELEESDVASYYPNTDMQFGPSLPSTPVVSAPDLHKYTADSAVYDLELNTAGAAEKDGAGYEHWKAAVTEDKPDLEDLPPGIDPDEFMAAKREEQEAAKKEEEKKQQKNEMSNFADVSKVGGDALASLLAYD